jgi:hypothetical protein
MPIYGIILMSMSFIVGLITGFIWIFKVGIFAGNDKSYKEYNKWNEKSGKYKLCLIVCSIFGLVGEGCWLFLLGCIS